MKGRSSVERSGNGWGECQKNLPNPPGEKQEKSLA